MTISASTTRRAASVALVLGAAAAAPAAEPPRQRWEFGDHFVTSTRRWEEKTETGRNAFVETARNPVFVELYDRTRGYTVRLYDDRMLIRDGTSPEHPKFVKFTKLTAGGWADGPVRAKWKYPGGELRIDGDAWVEQNATGTNVFAERGRTAEAIDLYDPVREYAIRLTATALEIRGGTDKVRQFKEFTTVHTGRWAPADKAPRLTVVADYADAPEAREWALAARDLCERWYPIVSARLNPNGAPAPRKYTLVFKKMDGVAFTANGDATITVSAAWIKDHPDDFGMVIHELTHAVQDYRLRKSRTAGWLVEGIADYVRYFEYEPERSIKPNLKKSYRDGYTPAAAFLNWIERTHDPQLIRKLNARLKADAYADEAFEEFTGRSLERLWAEYQAQK
jgi:hypothetical protein